MPTKEIYFSDNGAPATGLTPSFTTLKKVSDGSDVTPPASVDEVGGGWYKFDIEPTEKLIGIIDGGVALSINAERYQPVIFDVYDYLYEIYGQPVYDEDSDSLTFLVFILQNGKLRKDVGLTDCEINVYNTAHTLMFTITSSSQTNGVFVMAQSSPGLTKNENYYVSITVTLDGVDHESNDTFIALE